MIDRQYGNIIFECDVCDETLTTDEDEFNAALNVFRNNYWKSEKVGDEWTHLCSRCK